MTRITAEERSLARASLYRLLSLAFAYPGPGSLAALGDAVEAAVVAGELVDDPQTAEAVGRFGEAVADADRAHLESAYQRAFTLSYNEDCPLYETAFSARHLFQQTKQQADIAGFYRAFGVDPKGERPDHLALELEFLYLLTLKEAVARDNAEDEHAAVCRSAQRSFLRDHLARWAPQIAGRIAIAGRGTMYEPAARLLHAFLAREERYLRLGEVERFTDEPVLIADEPGEFACPAGEATPVTLQPVGAWRGGGDAGRRP